ncbi:MAG TPA: hypothetical protein VN814_13655 [Caulobacteraceae bacterium]|nr:hypothetical protein [Caulobacteraceae bacterium]
MQPYSSLSLITALTALLASILGPVVTLSVARHQFRANVLSTNRQKWIDMFRDRLAELLSVMNAAQVIKRALSDEWRGGAGAIHDNPALADKIEKTFMAVAQIQLLTKGAEPVHQALNEAIGAALVYLLEDDPKETDVSDRILEITDIARGIIRNEWRRVKRGV